jgi:Rrf2 family protein
VAVHVLAVLAYKEGEAVTSSLLASSVNTNPVVIRRLLLLLQTAGLVETQKGAGRGSRLSRRPERITLAEIYDAVENEEPFAPHSNRPNQRCPVGKSIQEALEKVFASAERALARDLSRTTLRDIVQAVKNSEAEFNRSK